MSEDFWKGYTVASVIAILIILFIGFTSKASDIKALITEEANKQGLDPAVALSIATIESSLNPKAVGKAGEVGLFQLLPASFPHYTKQDLSKPEVNARLGIERLLYYKTHCPTRDGYFYVGCFNQGLRNPKFPHLLPYYKRFMKVMVAAK